MKDAIQIFLMAAQTAVLVIIAAALLTSPAYGERCLTVTHYSEENSGTTHKEGKIIAMYAAAARGHVVCRYDTKRKPIGKARVHHLMSPNRKYYPDGFELVNFSGRRGKVSWSSAQYESFRCPRWVAVREANIKRMAGVL